MYRLKCPHCQSSNVKKNGLHHGVQLYKCKDCNRQFLGNHRRLVPSLVAQAYLKHKQTIREMATLYHVSTSTIRRHLHQWHAEREQPRLCNRQGYVHIDVTYWGHNDGLMLALDAQSGDVLYLSFIKHETLQDYRDAVQAIEEAGYRIQGIIIDGTPCLFAEFQRFPIQMCRFHMLQIIKRYLTKKPKMNAAKELLQLCRNMITMPKDIFVAQYEEWKNRWHDFLNKRTVHRDGKSYFLHRRVRSAMHRLDFYVPYLFTFQRPDCMGMPNTNNKIEGVFSDLKHHLNNHNGLTFEHRKQFIVGYFRNRNGHDNF